MSILRVREKFTMESKETVIFHHLDKCGGTTLQEYLKNYFNEDKICNIHTLVDANPSYQTKSLLLYAEKNILNSHFVHDPFGITLTLTDTQINRLSFFRKPIPRLISHWHMICRWHDHEVINLPKEFLEIRQIARTSFKDFLDAIKNQHPVVRHLHNFYVNHLLYNNISLRNEYYKFPLNPDNLKKYKSSCDAALAKFDFIGLVEDYDSSLLRLNAHLNIPPALQLQRLNVHRSDKLISRLDEETSHLLAEILSLDEYIYQRATEIYTSQKEKFFQAIGNTQDITTWVQNKYEQTLWEQNLAKQTHATVLMSQALKGSGWHARERNGQKISRWTGPTAQAYLDIALDRSRPLIFILRISNYLSIQQIQNLKISVDNMPLQNIKISIGGYSLKAANKINLARTVVVKGKLKKNNIKSLTRFTIHTGYTLKNNDTDDQRLLGIEILDLTITPQKNLKSKLTNFLSKRVWRKYIYKLL